MPVGVDFLDTIVRGCIGVLGLGVLFEVSVLWFRAAARQTSEDDTE